MVQSQNPADLRGIKTAAEFLTSWMSIYFRFPGFQTVANRGNGTTQKLYHQETSKVLCSSVLDSKEGSAFQEQEIFLQVRHKGCLVVFEVVL